MGNYIPQKQRKKKTIREALLEAEEDHYLDCPDAGALIRLAAFVIDAIFIFLALTTTTKIFRALAYPTADLADSSIQTKWLLYSAEVAFQVLCFYLMEIETLVLFGATPGKVLFGLRVINLHTGSRLSLAQAILRELVLKWCLAIASLGVSLLYPITRKDRRALYDVVTGSTVKTIHHEGP